MVHFAEQRAAPYSMKNAMTKRYTIDNNVGATHNVLCAITESGLDIHLVHLGTMGVYGYGAHCPVCMWCPPPCQTRLRLRFCSDGGG